jgi:hypothetical protein
MRFSCAQLWRGCGGNNAKTHKKRFRETPQKKRHKKNGDIAAPVFLCLENLFLGFDDN